MKAKEFKSLLEGYCGDLTQQDEAIRFVFQSIKSKLDTAPETELDKKYLVERFRKLNESSRASQMSAEALLPDLQAQCETLDAWYAEHVQVPQAAGAIRDQNNRFAVRLAFLGALVAFAVASVIFSFFPADQFSMAPVFEKICNAMDLLIGLGFGIREVIEDHKDKQSLAKTIRTQSGGNVSIDNSRHYTKIVNRFSRNQESQTVSGLGKKARFTIGTVAAVTIAMLLFGGVRVVGNQNQVKVSTNLDFGNGTPVAAIAIALILSVAAVIIVKTVCKNRDKE